MKLTGHKTEAVYRRYAIVVESDLRDAGSKLTAVLGTTPESGPLNSGDIPFGQQRLHNSPDSCFTRNGQSIRVRTAHQHRTSSQCESFYDVCARPDATVEQHRHFASRRNYRRRPARRPAPLPWG